MCRGCRGRTTPCSRRPRTPPSRALTGAELMEVTTPTLRQDVKVPTLYSYLLMLSFISIAAFHICVGEEELVKFSFLCPNGTLFNQQYFVCDWWFNVDCDNTEQFYSLNDELDTARQTSSLTSSQTGYNYEPQKVRILFLRPFNIQ